MVEPIHKEIRVGLETPEDSSDKAAFIAAERIMGHLGFKLHIKGPVAAHDRGTLRFGFLPSEGVSKRNPDQLVPGEQTSSSGSGEVVNASRLTRLISARAIDDCKSGLH